MIPMWITLSEVFRNLAMIRLRVPFLLASREGASREGVTDPVHSHVQMPRSDAWTDPFASSKSEWVSCMGRFKFARRAVGCFFERQQMADEKRQKALKERHEISDLE